MTKVRLTKTDDPDVFEIEELEKPTLGDDLIGKIAALDAQIGTLKMQLGELNERCSRNS